MSGEYTYKCIKLLKERWCIYRALYENLLSEYLITLNTISPRKRHKYHRFSEFYSESDETQVRRIDG